MPLIKVDNIVKRCYSMDCIYVISLIVFILYAPISIFVKNIANKVVNNKTEVWTVSNNSFMLEQLKQKNKKIYYMMIVEHIIFFEFLIVTLCKIIISNKL